MFPPDQPSSSSNSPHQPPEPEILAEHPFNPSDTIPSSPFSPQQPPLPELHPEPTFSSSPFFPHSQPDAPPATPTPVQPQQSAPSPSPPPPPRVAQPDGGLMMKLGTLVVIGAMAANVFGFRYSRWAVGKDIHRAWERRQRQAAQSSSAHSRAQEELRRMRDAFARAEQQATQNAQSAQQQRASARAQQRTAERERQQRENVRAQYAQWERRFDQSDGFYREQFRMQFDAKMMEDLLKQFGQAGRMGIRMDSSSFSFDERTVEQLLKAARQAQQQARRQQRGGDARFEQDFDAFRFWQAMNGAQWRDYARSGTHSGGVHRRVGMAAHYHALGLQEGASEDEVKKAYRREVMKWHPDRYRGDDKHKAARRFREVTDAYAALTKN